ENVNKLPWNNIRWLGTRRLLKVEKMLAMFLRQLLW
ncbi:unnamed protein product, partial [Allacma fusca]